MRQLLTVKQLSLFLKTSTSTIYRYSNRGLLPHYKTRFGLRFQQDDIEKWLEEDKRKVTQADNILKNALTNSAPVDIDVAKGGKEVARATKSRHNYGYGAIYIRDTKAGKPRFYLDYYDRNRRRVQKLVKNVTTWQEAHEALKNAVLKEHFDEYGIGKQKQQIRFQELSELFLENYSKPNKKSWKCDYYAIEAHLIPFFGRCTLTEITPLLVEKFRAEKLNAGLAKSSTNRLLALLKRMYSVANTWNLVKINPVKQVKLFSEQDNKRERILSSQEEERLLLECADHLKPIIIMGLNSGMRRNEILTLSWSQVDLKQRLIHVIKTKSGKNRMIPINDVLFNVLCGLKKLNTNDYVFPNPATGEPFKSIRHSFENACRRANIKGLRFHDLRHSFSCRLLQKGCDIETLRSLLGHHSITVTERYIHTNEEQKRKAVDLLAGGSDQESLKRTICDTEVTPTKEVTKSPLFSVN
ncbi:MAG: tyrosine-type recombinase/integrase [Candidatus Aminicenantes bacterium]|nr:tyrosine-type recombinase/integrase [Candidatus Aminicenantes bacterium]